MRHPTSQYPHPPDRQRTCRACGCTTNDCQACIVATGAPCWWVEPDLCSRHVDATVAMAHLADSVAADIGKTMGFVGVVIAFLNKSNEMAIGIGVNNKHKTRELYGLVRVLQLYSESIAGESVPINERAACIHCKQNVAFTTEVDAIREHAMTCAESPIVRELAAARTRIAQLEVELADVMSDRAEIVRTWEPSGPMAED